MEEAAFPPAKDFLLLLSYRYFNTTNTYNTNNSIPGINPNPNSTPDPNVSNTKYE